MISRYFDICKKISLTSNHYQHKIGSCIVIKNRVISFAANQLKTHPASIHRFHSSHAEFLAIRKAKRYNLKGATIYVFRQQKDNSYACSKPCPTCREEIKRVGIKKIVYTDYNNYCVEDL